MKKLGCAKCGGVKKMKVGGSAVAKAPVNMYGIPQENMGTSSQMGFGRNGGSVKKPLVKAQTGGTGKFTSYRNAKGIGATNNVDSDSFRDKKTGTQTMSYVKTNPSDSTKGTRQISTRTRDGKVAIKKENVKISDNPGQQLLKGYNSNMKAIGKPETTIRKTVTPIKNAKPSKKIIDSSIKMNGPDRPASKPMVAKKGGVVKSKKK